MWKDLNPATQKRETLQQPKYTEDEWWTAGDIQREVKRLTKKYISLQKIGRIAKESGLIKDSGKGFKLYHKDLITILVEFIKYYYGGK